MESNISDNLVECPICGSSTVFSGKAQQYTRSCHYKIPIYFCKSCDIFYKDVNKNDLVDHFYAANYIQDENEERFFHDRINFFEFIISLAEKYNWEAEGKELLKVYEKLLK